jgi:uncharacterized membrane protein YhaH (DUF805 family)
VSYSEPPDFDRPDQPEPGNSYGQPTGDPYSQRYHNPDDPSGYPPPDNNPYAYQPPSGAYGQPSGNFYGQQYAGPYADPSFGYNYPYAGQAAPGFGPGQLPPETNFYPGRQYPGGEPPLGQPYYGISFPGAIARCLAKYARFDGRASRSEYWWWTLAVYLAMIILGIGSAVIGTATAPEPNGFGAAGVLLFVLLVLLLLALIVPNIAIAVRRLHDANMSGALWLLTFIPYVGSFIVLILTLMPSRHEGVRFNRPDR